MKSVLFLDEEHALRTVFSEVLRNEGFEVLEAADMAQAVQACDEYGKPIDLSIISTIDGMSAAKRLAETHPHMRILLIGHPEWKPKVRRLRGLNPPWLQKPFTSEELLEAVHRLANGRGSHAGK
jgi:DNA-binding NtrC family response regulator